MKRDTSFVDAFRGFAAFWVVIGHCQIMTGYPKITYPSARQAVDLFMVISGFLMVLTIDVRARANHDVSWRAFYLRRFFRIAPIYYLALIVLVLVWRQHLDGFAFFRSLNPANWPSGSLYDSIVLDLKNLLLHVTFLFGFSPEYSFSTMLPDWSLAIEFQFYAAFPLFYWIIKRQKYALLLATGIAAMVATAGYAVAVSRWGWPPFRETSLLIFKLEIFAAGMLIYEAGRESFRVVPLLFAFVLLVLSYRHTGFNAIVPIGLIAIFAGLWLLPHPPLIDRLSRSGFVRFAADCSYPAYLVHGFVLSVVAAPAMARMMTLGYTQALAAAAVTVMVVVLTYLVSYIAHRLIERPGIRLGAMIARRFERQPAGGLIRARILR